MGLVSSLFFFSILGAGPSYSVNSVRQSNHMTRETEACLDFNNSMGLVINLSSATILVTV